jgi:hypothetical protein
MSRCRYVAARRWSGHLVHLMTSSDAGTELIRALGSHEWGPRQERCGFDVEHPFDGVVRRSLNGGRRLEHNRTVEGSGRLKESNGVSTALRERV